MFLKVLQSCLIYQECNTYVLDYNVPILDVYDFSCAKSLDDILHDFFTSN